MFSVHFVNFEANFENCRLVQVSGPPLTYGLRWRWLLYHFPLQQHLSLPTLHSFILKSWSHDKTVLVELTYWRYCKAIARLEPSRSAARIRDWTSTTWNRTVFFKEARAKHLEWRGAGKKLSLDVYVLYFQGIIIKVL